LAGLGKSSQADDELDDGEDVGERPLRVIRRSQPPEEIFLLWGPEGEVWSVVCGLDELGAEVPIVKDDVYELTECLVVGTEVGHGRFVDELGRYVGGIGEGDLRWG
jgi:hypothetical protein